MRHLFQSVFLVLCLLSSVALASNSTGVPILVYHNFDPTSHGMMTISTAKFEEQMRWLKANSYTVIPLKELVGYLQGKIASLPPKPVVITDDDGRESVYKYMLPIVRKYNIPVTLFIYPLVISHVPYALTWAQLKELQNTGLFDIEDHTYWHPNFKHDKKLLPFGLYQKMVHVQLVSSKNVLEKKLGIHITLLAWPFGIHDEYLEQEAAKAGYTMAFSISGRDALKSEKAMAMPRYMIVESQSMGMFEAIVKGQAQKVKRTL